MKQKNTKLYKCTVCNKTGIIRGIFHAMICDTCSGMGLVGEGGEALQPDQIVSELLRRLEITNKKNKALGEEVVKLRQQINNNPVYPQGSMHE